MDIPIGYSFLQTQLALCEKYGWTLEYVEDLLPTKRARIVGYLNGLAAGEKEKAEAAKNRRKR